MRIAFTGVRGVPDLYSGSETVVTEISTRLVQKGHEVIVYCRKGYGDESEPTYKGVKKIYLPRIKTKQFDTLSHTFFSLIHLFFHPVDVIIQFNAGNGPFCVIPRLRGIKVACNTDGVEWQRKKWGFVAKQYWKFGTWCCMKLAPAIIADSRKLQELYKKWYKRDTTYIAYGGPIETSEHPEILDEYGLKPDDYFFVGSRLEPENNADIIVEAFEQVRTDKKLVIAGTANYKSRFIQKLRKTKDPRIIFTGGVYKPGHMKELHCNCFAYIHGCEVGGTNPSLLKALGYGNCVLYLDVEFNAEVAQNAGIPFPRSAEELRREMQALVDDPEKASRYRELAPERIKQDYTWDKVAGQYEQLCLRLHESR
jgi:glycosyltransferase involved in cell wall biosynthesis